MADQYFVHFICYGIQQDVMFEDFERAKRFADDVHKLGYNPVEVYDEFDPRTTLPPGEPGDLLHWRPVYVPQIHKDDNR